MFLHDASTSPGKRWAKAHAPWLSGQVIWASSDPTQLIKHCPSHQTRSSIHQTRQHPLVGWHPHFQLDHTHTKVATTMHWKAPRATVEEAFDGIDNTTSNMARSMRLISKKHGAEKKKNEISADAQDTFFSIREGYHGKQRRVYSVPQALNSYTAIFFVRQLPVL